jgi:hypothetical protein
MEMSKTAELNPFQSAPAELLAVQAIRRPKNIDTA